MRTTLWLHIGAVKTGTTSIQMCFAENREKLRQAGVLYPTSPGPSNHIGLTAYALADDKMDDDTRILCEVRDSRDLKNFREDLENRLIAEVSTSNCPTIVLSNEHCSARLRTRQEVERLKSLCDKLAHRVRVVLYMRNPVDFLASWYSTSVIAGNSKPFPSPIPDALLSLANFRSVIDLWTAVFGQENLTLRRFERRRFVNQDLIQDFCATIQLPDIQLDKPKPHNESLSLPAISFLREFNKHLPRITNGRINPLRGPVVEALRKVNSEARFTLPQQDADYIMRVFREDHQYIANKFFGEQGDLFEPARSVSASGALNTDLVFEESIRISALIWSYLRKRNIRLNERLSNVKSRDS